MKPKGIVERRTAAEHPINKQAKGFVVQLHPYHISLSLVMRRSRTKSHKPASGSQQCTLFSSSTHFGRQLLLY